MNPEYKQIVKLASIEAGQAILEIYNTADFGVEMKSNNSPLTLADQAAHNVIVKHLSKTPYPILSEEGKDIIFEQRNAWPTFWMVDPLDGTKEFIKKNGEFTVNIALIEKGKAVFGAVYVPVTEELYTGEIGYGATKEQNGQLTDLKKSKDLPFTELCAKPNLRVVASRSHLNQDTKDFLNSLDNPEIVSMGSSLKFMALADDKADIYPRFAPTMEWDTAAAHAIMNSLNYHIETKEGTELEYNKQDLLNPHFICY